MLSTDIAMLAALVAAALLALFNGARRWQIVAAVVALLAGTISAFRGSWQAGPAVLAALLLIVIWSLAKPSSRPLLWLRRVTAGVSVLLVVASCALFYFLPIFSLPLPDGPHTVGTLQFDLTDTSRKGVLEDPPDTPRRILVRAWYPASGADDLPTRPYLTPQEVDDHALGFFLDFGLPHFLYRHFKLVRTHSHLDAAVDAKAPLPVIVFSHGYWCWPGQNTALMEKLASHGYLVFSIGHPYDAGTMSFADGVKIPTSPNRVKVSVPTPGMLAFWTGANHEARYAALRQFQQDFDQHRVMQSLNAWRDDIRYFVDLLAAKQLPASAQKLQEAANLSRLGFAGMSFGGTSSASACNRDERCKAALNLDGEEFDWSLYDTALRMPIAVMHSDWVQYPLFGPASANPAFNISCDYAYEPWNEAGNSSSVYRTRLVGTKHLAFTDLPLSARGFLRDYVYGKSDPGSVLAATNDFVLGFFDATLNGQGNDFPAIVYRRHADLALPHTSADVREWWTKRH